MFETTKIDGTDKLTATKRAELRGVISTRPGLNRYLRVTPGGLLRADAGRARAEENLDGKYLLRTSDPKMTAEDIALIRKFMLAFGGLALFGAWAPSASADGPHVRHVFIGGTGFSSWPRAGSARWQTSHFSFRMGLMFARMSIDSSRRACSSVSGRTRIDAVSVCGWKVTTPICAGVAWPARMPNCPICPIASAGSKQLSAAASIR